MASLEGTSYSDFESRADKLTGLVIKIQSPNAEETRTGLRSNRPLEGPRCMCRAALLTRYQNSCQHCDSGQQQVSYFCAAFGHVPLLLVLATEAIFTKKAFI